MAFIKRYLFWVALAAGLYVLLNYHFLFIGGGKVEFLKKVTPTLECTFYSLANKSNTLVFSREDLREAGVADMLVEIGRMSEAERDRLIAKFEEEDSEGY
jgi:hypothetical protein